MSSSVLEQPGAAAFPILEKKWDKHQSPMGAGRSVDVRALECALRKGRIDGEVRFDADSIGLYDTDSSTFREPPLGVMVPRTGRDVVNPSLCAKYSAPIVSRGAGTSLSGETVNFAVVIDHSKYLHKIGEPDVKRRMITVQPGAVNGHVNEVAGKKNLVFGPDPATHAYCTIGGKVGNNSCGVHSVQSQLYGSGPRTSDNVYSMEIVTYGGGRFRVRVNEESELGKIIRKGGRKGEIYRTFHKRSAGPPGTSSPNSLILSGA